VPLKVCLEWTTVGPYHAARIRAAAQAAASREIEVVVCEAASVDLTGMRATPIEAPIERRTVFPDRSLAEISPRDVENAMMRTLDEIQPDVVAITGNSTPEARGCLRWCIANGRGSVLMTESREEDAVRSKLRESLKSIIVRAFDAALVAGTPHRTYASKLGMPDSAIFDGYSVVDNDYFSKAAEAARMDATSGFGLPALDDDSPFFISVGRMIERKDFQTLLAAYRRYAEMTEAPWRLVIAGDGRLRPELERYVAENDLNVAFVGHHPNSVMPIYYARAGALVHPALSDQWGLVVNEAMASGLPAIVSTGTGCGDDLVVDGVTGYRFPTSDDVALAEAMRRISTDDTLQRRMGLEAARHVKSWSVDRFGRSFVSAVERAAAAKRRTRVPARIVLTAIRLTARKMTSFHSVEV